MHADDTREAAAAENGVISVQAALPFSEAPVVSRRRLRLDVHSVSVPAGIFTGDFYYYTTMPTGFWAAVGDVAGKGLKAAVYMAMIHEQLEQLASKAATPCATVRSLNALLRLEMPRNRFATMAAVQLSSDGTLNVANAGHCPVLIRRRGGSVESIQSHGPALGFFENARWHAATTRFERGDRLVLVSDGLVEARNGADEFGMERIADILGRTTGSSREVADAILGEVDRFAGGVRHDDQTLLVVSS